MSEILTKSRARNIFYGGSLFFIVVFVAMTIHSHGHVVKVSTAGMPLSPEVRLGKHVWERHSCINCHTLHGEGAYFAPELGNVMTRWGVQDDPAGAKDALAGWMDAMPTGIAGRRQMPQFNLTDEEYRNLADFLLWTNRIRTQNWPPNDAG